MKLEGNTMSYKITDTIVITIKKLDDKKLLYKYNQDDNDFHETFISNFFDSNSASFKKGFMVEKGPIYFLEWFTQD